MSSSPKLTISKYYSGSSVIIYNKSQKAIEFMNVLGVILWICILPKMYQDEATVLAWGLGVIDAGTSRCSHVAKPIASAPVTQGSRLL